MRKVDVTLTFDDDKLDALTFFLSKQDTTPLKELAKKLDELYAQYVPADTREYVESRSAASRPKPKRPTPKPQPQVKAEEVKS